LSSTDPFSPDPFLPEHAHHVGIQPYALLAHSFCCSYIEGGTAPEAGNITQPAVQGAATGGFDFRKRAEGDIGLLLTQTASIVHTVHAKGRK